MRSAWALLLVWPLVSIASGCSSLGLSLWPSQLPLLSQTKQFAAKSPRPSGLPNELSKQTLPEYFVEPGDRILIEPVALDSDFRSIGDQQVQIDGSIDLGEFGRLRVAGMTVEMIETAIENQLDQVGGESEPINVQLVETNAAEVYVLGDVGSPGAYALDGHETVLDAILRAGGLTSTASPCDIILVRPTNPGACRVVLPVCYRQITQLGDVGTNYQLQPGDRIVVGSRTLCEELAVWRQTKGCKRCCPSKCVECKPQRVHYRNRIVEMLVAFPLPLRKTGELEVPADELPDSRPGGDVQQPSDIGSQPEPGQVDDSDIFLPKETRSGAAASKSVTPKPLAARVFHAPNFSFPN